MPIYAVLVIGSILQRNMVTTLYTWHPLLEVVFYITAVVGVLQPQSRQWADKRDHSSIITKHGYWQLAAMACVAAGTAVMYVNKELKGKQHLKSWHGVLGAVATLWWAVQVIAGTMVWYFPRAVPGGPKSLRKAYFMHKLFGYLSLLLLTAAHATAAWNGYPGYERGSRLWLLVLTSLLTTTFLAASGAQWRKPKEA